MKRVVAKRYRISRLIGPLMGISLTMYFGYHLLQGDRGWFALQNLETAVNEAHATHDEVRAEYRDIEHRVQLLRPGTLDADMLDERARAVLGYVGPDDIVVIN